MMKSVVPDYGGNECICANQGVQYKGRQIGTRLQIALWVFAIAYAIGMLAWGGATWTRLYGPSPYHRYQAASLLDGHLHIGDSIQELDQNLALHDGKVQHVWGLGVGIWLVPFELFYRLIGQNQFPDRVAMGVAFGLLAAYASSTGLRLSLKFRKPALGLAWVVIVLFVPPLLTLNAGRQLIYEDTVLYACMVSLGILTAVVRIACFGRMRDFLICAILAAMAGFVRPTHAVYGLAGITICSIMFWGQKDSRRGLLAGNGIFLVGLCLLALTNCMRFGSPLEFGHSMTATGGPMVYFTRFGNPFKSASLGEANCELFGALFLTHAAGQSVSAEDAPMGMMAYPGSSEKIINGQSAFPRWRDMYMSTFDLSYVVIVLSGFSGATIWLWRRKGRLRYSCRAWTRLVGAIVPGLLLWSGITMTSLWLFYLHFPILCARYLLDFVPAFAGALFLSWFIIAGRLSFVWLTILILWLCWEVKTSNGGEPRHFLLKRQEIGRKSAMVSGRSLETYNGIYAITNHPSGSRIAYNGEGWMDSDGSAANVVVLAVDRPEFVEVTTRPWMLNSELARPDELRVKIDNIELKGVSKQNGNLMQFRFDVPEKIRRRRGNELLFICFTHGCDQADRESLRILESVRWR